MQGNPHSKGKGLSWSDVAYCVTCLHSYH